MDIFVISTNENVVSSLSQFLGSAGYETQGFSKIYEALASIRKSPPRLVLATYDGGTDDVEAIFRITEEMKQKFVVITRKQDRNHAIELLGQGAFAYVLEPLNVLELKTVVQRALDESLEGAKRFTFDILANLDDGIAVLDSSGVILFVNPRLAQILGRNLTELVGTPSTDWFEEPLQAIQLAVADSASRRSQGEISVGPANAQVRVTVSLIHDVKEEIVGQCVQFRAMAAVTEDNAREFQVVEEAAAKFLRAAGRAKELDEIKSKLAHFNLIQTTIDELKKPLVLDHISVPVEELIELPAIRAKNQLAGAGTVTWDIDNKDLRLRCRRKLVETFFIHVFMSSLSAKLGGDVKVTVQENDDDLVFRLIDEGSPANPDHCFTLTPNAQGRGKDMSLYLAQRLVAHHKGRLVLLEDEPGLAIHLTNIQQQ
ncbi:MAG: PAS domain-containing protein [Planctomycetota bacterium]|nr:PAS domain-containing protein [Planctomycetota bacterium]